MTKGVARAPRSPPRGGAAGPAPDRPGGQPAPRLRARPAGRASLGANESAAATGARPPRFLFSFSTPRAAGAALHRRGFPGTLPLTPLSAPRGPGPSSTPRETGAGSRSPARPPHPPAQPARLALKPGRRGAGAGAVPAGLRWVCARGGAENPAWSARGAPGGPGAHARPRTCPARTPSSRGAAAPAGSPRKPEPHRLGHWQRATWETSRETRWAAPRLLRTRATVSEG